MADKDNIRLRIRRQENARAKPYWEEFSLPYRPGKNIISVLMEIQQNPVNAKGEKTTPVIWECNCLEEVCGACSILINGKAQQACTALIDRLQQPITLQPLTKFPLIRDLVVDRSVMFKNLKLVRAWIPIDGTYDLGPGPRMAAREQEWAYHLSRCMTCGCCMEACPNVNDRSQFIGPAALSQVRLFNTHPTGAMNREERLEAIVGPGGIGDCGNAQNCIRACPKEIPLTTSIAALNNEVNWFTIKRWLWR